MPDDLNNVNIGAVRRSYHHGALREALITAAEQVIAERGVDGFSLREAARRAGVSPTAPGYHFRDTRGLLTAVATAAFRDFGEALAAADVGPDRVTRLRAQGMAYVRFALANPARFDLMWRKSLIDNSDAECKAAGERAFKILDRVVRGEDAHGSACDSEATPSIAAWSIVHGFARLALDGMFGTERQEVEQAVEALLPRVLEHLEV